MDAVVDRIEREVRNAGAAPTPDVASTTST
jgi:hypothetical protein